MRGTVSRPKIRDLVAQRISAYIADRGLKPGDRLPNENELAASFGVSRMSLREATKALEFLGIVEAKPGIALSVGRTNLKRMTAYLEFHPTLWDASPQDLIGTRWRRTPKRPA